MNRIEGCGAHDSVSGKDDRLKIWWEFAQGLMLSVVITGISRGCLLRDLLLGRVGRRIKRIDPRVAMTRHWIPSGEMRLDSVLVTPVENTVQATLLICHGIGETVQHWLPVQRMLARRGVASLVFDYAGYGRSSGFFDAMQAEDDAVSAFQWLRTLTPTAPVWLLGFSLGSGIAASVASRIPISGLVLCAAFTSLREAATSSGFPALLNFLVPPIWRNTESLQGLKESVLIVHGENDRLFPTQMAKDLKAAAGDHSKLILVANLKHDEPHRCPTLAYWDNIAVHVTRK